MARRTRFRAPAARTAERRSRWLLLVHVLPASPSNLRVRTWRRLQQLGAIAVKQSVYVLPDSAAAREDFEWLRTEIVSAGGEAMVFAAGTMDDAADQALVDQFRRARDADYAALAREVEQALAATARPRARAGAPRGRRSALDDLRQRLSTLERLDFFGHDGREKVEALLARLEAQVSTPAGDQPVIEDARRYRGRVWVTRPRPGVDRMASAWLIKRFIDPDARFAFAAGRGIAAEAIAFDMFDGEFRHHGDRCTFEVLRERFAIRDPAVARLAGLVHDLDIKDGKFGAADAPAIDGVIRGLQLSHPSDDALLAHGMQLFEALYRGAPRRAAGRRRRS
jgi:hypothetical protein